MNVLVTGGAGYLGSNIVSGLLERGHKISVLDNLSTGRRESVDQRASFFEGDLANESLLRSVMAMQKVSVIVHAAGFAAADASLDQPLNAYRGNVVATRSLLESALACGVDNFVQCSTTAVYGDAGSKPVNETSPIHPLGPYAASMAMAEQMLIDTSAAHNLNFVILRLSNVAGKDSSQSASGGGTGYSTLIKAAIDTVFRRPGNLPIYGIDHPTEDGTAVRDYLHVRDAAMAVITAVETVPTRKRAKLILNCGSGQGHSVKQVLRAVEKATGVKIPTRNALRRPFDVSVSATDTSAILQEFGWSPQHSELERIVFDAGQWERELVRHDPARLAANRVIATSHSVQLG